MKIIFSGILIFFISLVASGQSGFLPGYIIKNNGDSLVGLVYYGYSNKFEKECRFKRFEIADDFHYDPEAISAYGFKNGRRFESKKSGGSYLFYECLVKGPVSLYAKPSNHDKFYVASERDGFIKLSKGATVIGNIKYGNFREYLASITNQPYPVTPNDYTSTALKQYLRESGLPMFVYNQTVDRSFIRDYSITKYSPLWQLGITGGYQFLFIDMEGDNSPKYFEESEYDLSYRPAFGVYMNRRFSRLTDRASAELCLLYISDTYHGYSEYNSTYTYRDDILIEFSSIQVPLMLKFKFGKAESKIRPVFKAGVYGSFVMDYSYSRYTEKIANESIYSDYFEDYKVEKEMGYIVATGIDVPIANHNLGVELGFSHGSFILSHNTKNLITSVKSNCIQLMLKLNL